MQTATTYASPAPTHVMPTTAVVQIYTGTTLVCVTQGIMGRIARYVQNMNLLLKKRF